MSPSREECLRSAADEMVRYWQEQHPIPVVESADDDRGYERLMRLIDVEYSGLVAAGRMPPHETGLYALEAHRLGIYPVFTADEAARLLEVTPEALAEACASGEIDSLSAYDETFIGISAMHSFAAATGRKVRVAAGGGWLEVSDAERRRLREEHERHVLARVPAAQRKTATEQLRLDAARADAYLAAHLH